MSENKTKNVSIYLPDKQIFNQLCEDTTKLFYIKTGKMMQKNELLIKSLLYFKSFLLDEVEATPTYRKGIKAIGRLNR